MTADDQSRIQDERAQVLLSSYHLLTGEPLASDEYALWHSRTAVVAHNTASLPLFFYANHTALALFRMGAQQFIGMPSAHSAEADQRAERAEMLAQLDRANIITGYNGVRIAADGTRFRITGAVIWNLIDEAGQRHGQAARIADWEMLG